MFSVSPVWYEAVHRLQFLFPGPCIGSCLHQLPHLYLKVFVTDQRTDRRLVIPIWCRPALCTYYIGRLVHPIKSETGCKS